MVEFRARQHRLEIPPAPNSDDPAVQKKYSNDLRRLVMDEFNRLASDFYDFKQATYNAAVIPLRSVANIVVIRDQYTMSVTWENPDGQSVEPTFVRIRIKEITPNSWATYTYPKSSWSFSGLNPNTQYTLEIQLIAQFDATDTFVSTTRNCPSVPVLRIAESDIKAKVFTTLPGVPPPTDAATNNTTVNFTFPTTNGTPGAVSSADCWWGYKFQYRTACTWADTAVSEAFAAGAVGDVPIDTNAAPFTTHPNALFRIAFREICDAVPQAWVYGNDFMAVDFSNSNCRGIVKSASLAVNPFSTADLFALPSACQSTGTNLQIVDDLTKTQFLPAEPGFKCIEYIDGEWTLIGDDTTNPAISNRIYQPILSGSLPAVALLNDESDFSLRFEVNMKDNALVLAGGTGAYAIINIGQKIRANFVGNTSSYTMTITVPRDGGGQYTFSAPGLTYGVYNEIWYAHDVSEPDGRKLWANGILVDQSANAILNDFTGIDGSVQINTLNDMRIRGIYGFASYVDGARAVTPTVIYQDYIQTGAVDTHSIPHSALVMAGDLIVVCLRTRTAALTDAALDTPPTGFTLARRDDASAMYWKVADGTETGNVSVTATTGQSTSISGMSIQYIRGCDPGREFGGYHKGTARDVFQAPLVGTEIVQRVHDTFLRVLPEGVGIMGVVMHSAVENATAPAVPVASEIVAADQVVTSIQRANTTGTFIKVSDAEGIVDGVVRDMTTEWATSSFASGFWFNVNGTQTPIWNSVPRVIEQVTRDSSSSLANKHVKVPADTENGDLVVAFLQAVWGTASNLDGMTQTILLTNANSIEWIVSKIYATADGSQYDFTTSYEDGNLSYRSMVWRVVNAGAVAETDYLYRSNSFPGPEWPYQAGVDVTAAVGDSVISGGYANETGTAPRFKAASSQGFTPVPVPSRVYIAGPTPDSWFNWTVLSVETAGVIISPIYEQTDQANTFDRAGFLIRIPPAP